MGVRSTPYSSGPPTLPEIQERYREIWGDGGRYLVLVRVAHAAGGRRAHVLAEPG